ncbi:unnamed protein product, partial [Prunus brigantina]
MKSPTTKKEIQSLTGRAAILNRFLSRSIDKCRPFFKVLKKGQRDKWDEKGNVAFQNLKTYLTSPPMLSKPIPCEDLFIYLAVSNLVVNSILIQDELRAQHLIAKADEQVAAPNEQVAATNEQVAVVDEIGVKECANKEESHAKVSKKSQISSIGVGLLRNVGSGRGFCANSDDSELKDLMGYMNSLKNYEKSGVPTDVGTDLEDGFDLGRMRRLL